jgi:predicted RecB family nuclease
LIRRKGDEHERAYLAQLRAEGRSVLVVDTDDRDWGRAARVTADAIRSGSHDVVYQAVLLDSSGWRGVADFLERQPDGSYEVADTKLARTSKPTHLLQLAFYSEQVARIQGRLPDLMHIVLGSGERVSYRVRDFDAYYRQVRRRFLEWVVDPPATYPYPVEHCTVCDWLPRCTQQWRDDDHLSFVAQMRRRWVDALGEVGITTLEQLASAEAELETSLQPRIYERLRRQAELQHRARITGKHVFELLPLVEGRGLDGLPRPSEGDVFFDIEGDPFYEAARGLEYLFGVAYREGDDVVFAPSDGVSPLRGQTPVPVRFRAFWATERAQEQEPFERLVDFLTERLARVAGGR